jgi:hypothetical protein
MPSAKVRQGEIAARLRPWLDLAALLPFDSLPPFLWKAEPELLDRLLQEGAAPQPLGSDLSILRATKYPASALFRHGILDEQTQIAAGLESALFAFTPQALPDRTVAARLLYSLFFSVRWAFETIVKESDHRRRRVQSGRKITYPSSFSWPYFGFSQNLEIDGMGGINIRDDRAWASFREAVKDVEAERLRRCPVCMRIYYAARLNKQACDEHLLLAAVWRTRGKLLNQETAQPVAPSVKKQSVRVGRKQRSGGKKKNGTSI